MKSIKSKEVAVLLIGPFNDTFDYLIEENINEISPGQIVLAPFRQRKVVGIIVSEGSKTVSKSKLKTVIDIYELDPIPLPTIDLISFLANWNCVYKGLVLKMVLSPLEAIISPQYNKVYKYNLEDGLSIDSIDNKKLRSKRKLVLDALVNSDKEVYETSLIQDIGVSKTILKDMVNKNLIVEKLIKIKPDFSKNFIKSNDIKKENDKPLNEHQKNAVDKINKSIKKNEADCFLLDGVPGSGKTETYFETVQTCLDERKQVLILLPEIALTPDWQKRFYNKFNFNPLVWHSDISKKKRKEIWLSALSGTAGVIVGARSALMIPISKLGLIVVDEEHEPAFKQEENVRYNARDMAVYRAKRSSATIVLASATPSLETFYNMRMGKYIHLTLPKRATGADMPDIKLLDLKLHPPQKGNWISPLLINQIQDKLLKKEQTLLFLNRRGYAPLRVCNSCGNKVKCINCETWLVEHRLDNLLTCHHCGYSKHISNICEVCGNKDQMKSCGPGVERIEEEVQRLFPEAKSITLSSDTMKNQNLLTNAIEQIKNSEVDIIIGTQMVAKGHDFPKLKLVGIIDGDIGLSGGDLRASERSFQLLQQVAGRSGRHTAGTNDKGLVYLQTFDTENPIIKAIAQNNRDDFFEKELISRKNANMPPYGRLAAIILSSKFESNLDSFASDISRLAPSFKNVKIFGPAPAPMYFLRGKYRRRFLIKSDKTVNIQKVLIDWTKKINKPSSINLTIDIDPFSFM
ncbi:primosomal protein N' [Alphaproteobacteria bacterium]|jgi:primosomal protein N' (replication factor Y)|nr:primosomal protein N' [Alphaproteobacteria bacterium]